VGKISNEEVLQTVNETRTLLDIVGKWKRIDRACAKTWITTARYNWGKNEGEGYKRSEKNAHTEQPDEKQKLHEIQELIRRWDSERELLRSAPM